MWGMWCLMWVVFDGGLWEIDVGECSMVVYCS